MNCTSIGVEDCRGRCVASSSCVDAAGLCACCPFPWPSSISAAVMHARFSLCPASPSY
ncbi:hypothetical protein BC835DRAFT_1392852, partial [Cytidiella melzeri]